MQHCIMNESAKSNRRGFLLQSLTNAGIVTLASAVPGPNLLRAAGSPKQNTIFWKLDRPRPALPNSYFWTWDHSTNWVLDDPGLQASGCYNKYLKQPETFVEDYRRLTSVAAGLGIRGIVIWGFLRDSHGGVEAARRVAAHAASCGVAILPGFGTTWYGGAYYEGDHRYNLARFLRKHPDARMLDEKGQPQQFNGEFGACPAHPAYQEWLRESLHWLFREFAIGGLNLENGDLLVDYHPLTRAMRKDWPADDPEPFYFQSLSYRQALEAIRPELRRKLVACATYTGFGYGAELRQNESMGAKPPAMLKLLPPGSACQWTLTGMLLKQPLPLTSYLDDGAPAAAFENPNWPRDLRPPNPRSVGFVHQGSQWRGDRYQQVVSTIKEACLRAYRSGLEGVSIHGEMTARNIPNALNYLAFSHFTHWPEDTLRDFGRKTLGQVFGSEEHGEAYAEILSHWDAGTLTKDHKSQVAPNRRGFRVRVAGSACDTVDEYQRFRFWEWLQLMVKENRDRHYASPFPL
jgi:hypothetical protein